MADVKKIHVEIGGSSRGLQDATNKANKSLNTLGGAAQKMGGMLAGAFAGTALIAGLGRVVNKVAEFESTMRRVALISKGSEKELSNLARTLGKTTVFTANQAGDAMTFLAQAGFKSNQIIEATPGILELAAAAHMDLAAAADIASNVLSAYGIEASRINEINDILVTTTNNANTNVYQFAEAFKVVGPIAKGAGISINEVAGLIGALGDAGIQGSLAGTQLKTAISQLISPMSDAQAVLDKLGVSTRDSNGNLRSLTDIFRDLGKAGLTAEQSFAVFDQRAASGALVLAGAADKAAMLAEKTKEVGVASAQSAEQLDTLKGDIQLLTSAWEGLLLEGSKFNGVLRETIQFMTWFLDSTVYLDAQNASLVANADSLYKINQLIKSSKAGLVFAKTTDQVNQLNKMIQVLNEKAKAFYDSPYSNDGLDRIKLFRLEVERSAIAFYQAKAEAAELKRIVSDMASVGLRESFAPVKAEDTEKLGSLNVELDIGAKLMESYAKWTDEAAKRADKLALSSAVAAENQKEQNKQTLLGVAAATTAAIANGENAKSIIKAALSASIASAILKAFTDGTLGFWGALGASIAAPLVITGLFNAIPEFARGTSFAPGGMALVGERGPEMVNLPRGSSVTPNHMMNGGGGNQTIILKLNEYEFARAVNISGQNQGNNIARTTF